MESLHQGALLLVDDEPVQMVELARCLERAGYTVRQARSGPAALDLIRREPIDLVLLDVMMPGMSGLEALQVIRQRWSAARLPVIMLTTNDHADDIVEALELGATDYLTKPVELAVAMVRIRTHVACVRAEAARCGQDSEVSAPDAGPGLWELDPLSGQLRFCTEWNARLGWGEQGTATTLDAWFERVHEGDATRVRGEFTEHLSGRTPRCSSEYRVELKGGVSRWVLMQGVASRDATGQVLRVSGSIADRSHARLIDSLTGLPNRAACLDRIQGLLGPHGGVPRAFAVLAIDLDGFSALNERHGHAIGDQLLVEVGQRLGRSLRATDIVARDRAVDGAVLARVGGDEFTVVIDQLSHPRDAEAVSARVLASMTLPYHIAGLSLPLTASVGIAHAAREHARADDVLAEADAALRHVKARGGCASAVFTPALRHEMALRLLLETDLRWAIERDEFVLQFRPIVRLGTGGLAGVIADARWESPTRGSLPIDGVRDVAEACGVLVSLERWMLRTACAQAARWAAAFAPGWLHVPISRTQCLTTDLVTWLAGVLRETGIPPAALTIDLDPRVCAAVDDTLADLFGQLRALGVALGVGQFHAGGTLAGVTRYPFDAMSVPVSALLEEDGDEGEEADTPAILRVAHSLRMRVTVTEIESEAQVTRLRAFGCTEMAGPGVAAAVDARGIDALIPAPALGAGDLAVSS